MSLGEGGGRGGIMDSQFTGALKSKVANVSENKTNGSMEYRYDKLKEDFKFNLGLIEDRDVELGRYEATIQGLKECLRDKVREISRG